MRLINEKPMTAAERQARHRARKTKQETVWRGVLTAIAQFSRDQWASEMAKNALKANAELTS